MHGHVNVECLGVGGHRVVSSDLLAHAGNEHPGPGQRDGGQGVAGGPAAVSHRGEREPVLLTRHPHRGLTAHVQETQQHLAHLEVRLPEDEASADQIYRCPAERSVRGERVGGDEDQIHEGPGGQAGQVATKGYKGGISTACI